MCLTPTDKVTTAGMTYCALGALSLLGVLKETAINRDGLLSWLLSRQVAFKNIHGMTEEDYTEIQNGDNEEEKQALEEVELMDDGSGRPKCAGFNGRCNKMPDTCYSFWVGASLEVRRALLREKGSRLTLLVDAQKVPFAQHSGQSPLLVGKDTAYHWRIQETPTAWWIPR